MNACPHAHALRADIAEPPRFMQKLPIDRRGYPVPWFVDWINGEPEFRAVAPGKIRKAVNDRLCWVCGTPLFREEVFVIGPMCAVNRISSEPPSHRECATYAAMNCPFLAKPQMVRRKDGLPEKLPPAGVMVERNPGVTLLWFTRRYRVMNVQGRPGIAGAGILFQIGRPFRVEWYARGRNATAAEIRESIESGLPLLREAAAKYDGPEGMAHLEVQITNARRLVPRD